MAVNLPTEKCVRRTYSLRLAASRFIVLQQFLLFYVCGVTPYISNFLKYCDVTTTKIASPQMTQKAHSVPFGQRVLDGKMVRVTAFPT